MVDRSPDFGIFLCSMSRPNNNTMGPDGTSTRRTGINELPTDMFTNAACF